MDLCLWAEGYSAFMLVFQRLFSQSDGNRFDRSDATWRQPFSRFHLDRQRPTMGAKATDWEIKTLIKSFHPDSTLILCLMRWISKTLHASVPVRPSSPILELYVALKSKSEPTPGLSGYSFNGLMENSLCGFNQQKLLKSNKNKASFVFF